MPYKKVHYNVKPKPEIVDSDDRVITMLQFARKAGKLIYGFEACSRDINNGKVKLLLLTKDIADNSRDKIMSLIKNSELPLTVKHFGNRQDISAALGLPWTCIIGILDKNFAAKVLEYLSI
jgi:ribosomal protein L7Ae-like RNA K-turn-binding protein